ncbi:DEAD-box ATP-dependent RNA helicase 50 [Euphorbia peplus]|nr:DEAD-box ATP-dependent RNA helicase 50 [Euphorbia peplus]
MISIGTLSSQIITSRSHSNLCFLLDFDFTNGKSFLLEFDTKRRKRALVTAIRSRSRSDIPVEPISNLITHDNGDDEYHTGPPTQNYNNDNNGSTGISSAVTSQTPHSRDSAGSFRKLKAEKLKVLMHRALTRKKVQKDAYRPAEEDESFDNSIISDTEPESSQKEKTLPTFVSERIISATSPTQDYGASTETRTGKHMKSYNSDVEHGEYDMSDDDMEPDKSQRFVSRRAGSDYSGRAASSHLRGWGNVGSVDSFRPKSKYSSRQQKDAAENGFFSRKSFKDLGCSEFMIQSLKGLGLLRPAVIQAMAFTPVNEGKTCIVADQSGSGKTLAYLIPVIQRLRIQELAGLGKSFSRSPQVLVMVPTAELASQVLNNCRSLSKFGTPFRSMAATGGFSQKTQLESLEQGTDVLIVTPGRFTYLVKEELLSLSNLKCIVLDEVDILFKDEEFEAAFQSLMTSSPFEAQYLFVTATLPVPVYNKLIEIFPDCEVVMGPGMHRTSDRLEEVIVDCSGEIGADRTPDTAFANKKFALLQLVEKNPVPKTIVFCNKIETCRKVENALKRFDRKGNRVRVLPFHSALAQEARVKNMKDFMQSHPGDCSSFLVCTDRASRGIDFSGVNHVILFDYPRDPSEYVRRVGRTARGALGKGKAFILVVGKQVSLAQKVVDRNQKGHPLHDVPSAYEYMS